MNQSKENSAESGAILFLFLIMLAVVIGAVSYSFYVGQLVEKKIELQNASDAAAYGVANYAAQGVNMISANNLAIAAALHIAATVPLAAGYGSMAFAMATTSRDWIEESGYLAIEAASAGVVKPLDRYQKKIWQPLAKLSSVYLQIAAGTSQFNQLLAKYWFIAAPVRAIEMQRINNIGSIAVSLQEEQLKRNDPLVHLHGIRNSGADEAMCHSLTAVRQMPQAKRYAADVASWLAGPLLAIPGSHRQTIDKILQTMSKLTDLLPMRLAPTNCGWGIQSSMLTLVKRMARFALKGKGIAIIVANLKSGAVKDYADLMGTFTVSVKGNPVQKWKRRQCNVEYSTASAMQVSYHTASSAKQLAASHLEKVALEKLKSKVARDPIPKRDDWRCVKLPTHQWVSKNGKRFQEEAECKLENDKMFAQSEKDWINKNGQFYCDQQDRSGKVTGRVYDSIPHRNGNNQHICIDLRSLDPRCAYKPLVKVPSPLTPGCRSMIADNINRWRDACPADDANDDDQMDIVDEVVNTSEQIKTYVARVPVRKLQDIGFIYVADFESLKSSLRFMVVAANPVRLSDELNSCPPELVRETKAGPRCIAVPLVDFAKRRNLDSQNAMEEQAAAMAAGIATLSQTEEAKLYGSWNRAQWATSFSEVKKSGQASVDYQASRALFWPNWRAQLIRPSLSFVRLGLKRLMGGSTSDADSEILATFY